MAETISDQVSYSSIFGDTLHPAGLQLCPTGEDIEEKVFDHYRRLRTQGAYTTLVDGAFDVPHADREVYVRQARMLGAWAYAKEIKLNTDEPHLQLMRRLVGSDQLHLTVAVPVDTEVTSEQPDHSEGQPNYPWQERADQITGYGFELPDGPYRRTVDLVTLTGDPRHSGTPLESPLVLAEFLAKLELLDALVVRSGHDSIIAGAQELPISTIVIPDEGAYFANLLPQENNNGRI